MRSRFILLHYHIFKNAGSTIDWILDKNFPNSVERLEAQDAGEFVTHQEIFEFLEQHPQVSALTSHTFKLPSPIHPVFKFIEICLVRHPLDRLQSMYYYFRKITDAGLNSIKAKSFSLHDFLAWLIESQPFMTMNSQTCIFATGGDYFFPPSQSQLLTAIDRMREIKFLGIVDRFDESMVVAEFFLKPVFRSLDLSYVAQNESRNRTPGLKDRLHEMRSLCGKDLWNELCKRNELDLKLWELANQELDRRLSFVPELEQKMYNFRERCQNIRRQIQTGDQIPN